MSAPADQNARDRALRLDRHVVTIAPAGSGKTGLLVRRALRALATVDQPESVVCITFTNKAAAEIRLRIAEALDLAAGPVPDQPFAAALHADAVAVLERDHTLDWQLRANPDRVQAMTIDAFNQALASQLPILSGFGGSLGIAQDPEGLYTDAVLAVFDDQSLSARSTEEQAAISAVLHWADNRIDQLLPALTGLLARRDQWLDHLPQLLDTSGARDAEILDVLVRDQLRRLDTALPAAHRPAILDAARHAAMHWPQPVAINADALNRWPAADGPALPIWRFIAGLLLTGGGTWRRTADKRIGFPSQMKAEKRAFIELLEALADTVGAEAARRLLDRVRTLPEPVLPEESLHLRAALGRVLRLCYAELRVQFAQRGEADFIEVALAAVTAASGEAGAEAIAHAETRIRHLLIDEMQDTSESQIRLVRELTANWSPGDGRSLFLVGDPQQSIYAFRKADVRLFVELIETRRLGALELTVETLSANFRSAPTLIHWFNNRLGHLFPDQSDRHIGAVTYTPCTAGRADGGTAGVRIVAVASGDKHDEAAAAVDSIEALIATIPADASVAILAATRPQLTPVLDALRTRLAESIQAVDINPLGDRPNVRDVVQLIRAVRHPEDRLAWTALLRAPFVGLTWADLVVLSRGRMTLSWPERLRAPRPSELSADAHARLERLEHALVTAESRRAHLADAADALWTQLGGPACVGEDDQASIRQIFRLLRNCCTGGELPDWPGFERQLQQLYRGAGHGRIEALTIHKSKGLQYDHVVMVGCGRAPRGQDRPLLHLRTVADGALLVARPADDGHPGQPQYDFLHQLATDAADAEALRLLYVAMTRARERLTVVAGATIKASDGEVIYQPRAQSMAARLWPVIGSAFDGLEPLEPSPADPPETDGGHLPGVARLPANWPTAVSPPIWAPTERRTLKPSEQSLDIDAGPAVGDVQATLIGTMYHEALERVIADGVNAWSDGGRSRAAPMRAGLRRMGMPEDQVEPAVERVLTLLQRTLASPRGRWMLQPHPWHASEYHLSGWLEGHWVSAIIDRCLEDADGMLWVIDYKTTREPLASDADRTRYRSRAVDQYAPQLRQYADLLGRLRNRPRVACALFLAELGELITLPD
ncbi:UvrD-helicase domain-containing protein [uncultured Abyssibacter sp.]|uniref:UvrD-helicase domain-containing protein n=1 Tax=uncultured Abyssibacter sp. TaxID=2320202 RepID=UPI0032B1C967